MGEGSLPPLLFYTAGDVAWLGHVVRDVTWGGLRHALAAYMTHS